MTEMSESPDCALARNVIPELAAGVAAGDERAHALEHLAGCASCRAELEQAAKVIDDLLLLAPSHEPPAGFEEAVLSAIADEPRGAGERIASWREAGTRRAAVSPSAAVIGRRVAARRPAPRTVLRTAVAALIVLAVAVSSAAAVWRSTARDRQLAASYRRTLAVAHGHYLTAATIYTAQHAVGHLFGYQGEPSWIFLTVEDAAGSGTYQASLVTVDGRRIRLGDVAVADGKASFGTAVDISIAQIQTIQLSRPGSAAMTAWLR